MKLEYYCEKTFDKVEPSNPHNEIGILDGQLWEYQFISMEREDGNWNHMWNGEAWRIKEVDRFSIKITEQ